MKFFLSLFHANHNELALLNFFLFCTQFMLVKMKWEKESYVSENDTLFLEDETGRVPLAAATELVQSVVTGVVAGVRGRMDSKGTFVAEEFCFAELPPQRPISGIPSNFISVVFYVALSRFFLF